MCSGLELEAVGGSGAPGPLVVCVRRKCLRLNGTVIYVILGMTMIALNELLVDSFERMVSV